MELTRFQCIDQTNASETQVQIKRMDRIYSEASLTIIAVAGDNPDYGLPGVGTTPRRPQRYVQLGEIAIVEMFLQTNASLKKSIWSSRAWTYQEGFLSKSRLIFGDSQVSFVCGSMYCAESFTHEIPTQSLDRKLGFASLFSEMADASSSAPEKPAVASCIEEYTTRRLCHDSDSLNACLGILNSFDTNDVWSHLWGVIVQSRNWGSLKFWTYLRLTWYHPRPTRRREDFPSWSWVGWDGPIHNHLSGCQVDVDARIHVLLPGHKWTPILAYFECGLMKAQAGTGDAPSYCKSVGDVRASHWLKRHQWRYKANTPNTTTAYTLSYRYRGVSTRYSMFILTGPTLQ